MQKIRSIPDKGNFGAHTLGLDTGFWKGRGVQASVNY